MKKFQIFVSSTFTDLIDERQASVEAILKAGHIPAGMELFTASNQSQWTIIQKWIDESDIYMLILGGRYGSIEPESGLSYTELEYNYALEKKKPLFAVVMNKNALDEKVKDKGRDVLESKNQQKLEDFEQKVKSYMCSFFDDNKDIKLAIYESVGKLQQENNLIGWIRSDEVLNPKQHLDQITALQKEKEILNKELIQLKNSKPKNQDFEEFTELVSLFEKENISLKRMQQVDSKYPDDIDLLTIFKLYKGSLIVGVTNSLNSSTKDNFIFYDLAPQLQVHGLMRLENIKSSSTARRYIITEKGLKFLAFIAKESD